MRGGSTGHERSCDWVHVAAPAYQVSTATDDKRTSVSRELVERARGPDWRYTCLCTTQIGTTYTYLKRGVGWVKPTADGCNMSVKCAARTLGTHTELKL